MPLQIEPSDMPVDLPRLLAKGLQQRPDDAALISAEGSRSWRELDRASENYGANLLALGLKSGDRVASLMPNCPALVIHYLACFKTGIVATPLNFRYTPLEIDYALKQSGASALFAHCSRDADIAASKLAAQLPFGVISYGAEERCSHSFEALVERPAQIAEMTLPAKADPAIILFTSGSTGPAKGVTHSFETLGWMIASFIRGCHATSDDIVMSSGSLSHIGAIDVCFTGLAAGARVVIPRNRDADSLLPMLQQHRPTILTGLPITIFGLIRDPRTTPDDLASLRLCCVGGDKVPAELEREFRSMTGLTINEIFGMTEIGIAIISPLDEPVKVGSIGRAIAGYRLSVRDSNGSQITDGAEGRLWIKSPCNMIGYWESPEATTATIKDGWLDTGDVVKIDAEGYVWFCGRQKQMIVHDGSNISPQQVEDVLLEHPAVAMAGVIGVHDLVHGENVRAFVTLKPGVVGVSLAELIDFARARVGYKAPEEITVLERMPLTVSEKVDRTVLKEMVQP